MRTLPIVFAVLIMNADAQGQLRGAPGPLVVSPINSRYFTTASGPNAGRAVYLVGSHIWNNLQDGMGPGGECAAEPERFDYAAYLRFLQERGHNFIRLWRWEQFKSQAAGGQFHLCMTPQPWKRTGPGTARDGKPRYDLTQLDPAYFQRVRERVAAAGRAGIYVGVMFFDGWALHLSPSPANVEGHPFHSANNINGVTLESIRDYQELPLAPAVKALQEMYIRAMVDALQDLSNVLYEVANESSGGGKVDAEFAKALGLTSPPDWGNSTEWQYWVIDVVRRHEKDRGYTSHPMGMTMQFPVPDQTMVNDPLYASRAEWISPGYDDEIFRGGKHPMAPGAPPSRWYADPPIADGRKVVISDTDHYAPGKGDALWAWKSFLRGHHPILMDFGLIGGTNPPKAGTGQPGQPTWEDWEAARFAMGDTRRYAERMDLVHMVPSQEVASTRFALVNPGREYLVLQPDTGMTPFTVNLSPGVYAAEWFSVGERRTSRGSVTADRDGPQRLTPPFNGPAVVYLVRSMAETRP